MIVQRLDWIDALKSILIIIVIWGHLIQYYSGETEFWENSIWEIIYSFHMPLFIFISGYFFKNKPNLIESLKTKAIQLLLPGLTCAIILYIKSSHLNNIQLIDIKHIFESACMNLWYLKTLFICLLGGYIFFRFKVVSIITFILFWLFIRSGLYDYIEINLIYTLFTAIGGGNGLFFLLPFFILGYCFHHYNVYIKIKKDIYLISFFIMWYILMQFFNGLDTIYFASPKWFSNNTLFYEEIIRTIYRDSVALFAILFLFILFKKYYNSAYTNLTINKVFEEIGKNTLGIYIFQYLIIEMNLFNLPFLKICQNPFICIIHSILITLIFNQAVKYIQIYKRFSTLLIGG